MASPGLSPPALSPSGKTLANQASFGRQAKLDSEALKARYSCPAERERILLQHCGSLARDSCLYISSEAKAVARSSGEARDAKLQEARASTNGSEGG